MEIKQLRYFKRVADAGSVSRAAAALSVAQPAVSRQIAALEEALGTPLFFRNGRGVKLTEAGQQLYAHVAEILEHVRLAEQEVRDTVGVARGTIVVGATPTVVRIIAPPLLRKVEECHPELALEFTEGLSGYVNEWLSNGLLDVAIIHDATRTQHFLTEPLVREELVCVGGPRSAEPARFADVAAGPLILPRRHHGLRLQLERIAGHYRVPLNVRAEIDSLGAILTLVRHHAGVTVLPRGAVAGLEALPVRPIVEPSLSRTLLLATSSQRPVSQTTRTVINELKGVVRRLVETAEWPGAERATGRIDLTPPQPPAGHLPAAPHNGSHFPHAA
jgi:LysR family nitrogen assimilation transcriptional regulator